MKKGILHVSSFAILTLILLNPIDVRANYVPGVFNGWIQNTPYSTNNMPSGYQKYTTQASDDNQFKLLMWNNNWDAGWGSGYWINSWNTVWSLPYTRSGLSNAYVKSFGTNQYLSIVTSTSLGQATSKFGFLKTSASPINISSVSGGTSNVTNSTSVSISITLSGSKCNEEYILIRYTTDNWSTSNFVTATGSGTSYSATIPGQTAGTSVKWYALTSTVTNPSPDTDYLTLCVMNNSNSNYSYAVVASTSSSDNFRSKTSGNWSTASNWESSPDNTNWITSTLVPGSSAASISILNTHNITLNQDATIPTLTINSGGTFTASDATPRTLTISNNSSATTLSNSGTWANGSVGSTVVFTGAPSSGDAIHTVSGTIGFQNITINKTGGTSNIGASFGSGSTITGTLEIGNGGFVSTAPPASFYNSSAILKFNQGSGATYNVNSGDYSWSTTQVPQNITITSGTVNLNADRTASGNLLINGGTLILNNNTPNLTIQGDWTRTSGTFSANSGTVTLSGTTDGNVNVTGVATMNNLTISKTSGAKAILNCNLTAATLTINSSAILTVNPAQQLTVSTTMTNNGTLNLLSTSDGTATIITPTTIGGTTGTASVQQYLSTVRNWYMSSPVNNATAPSNYTYFKYDEPGNNSNLVPAGSTAYWESVAAGSGTLNPTTGYIVQVASGTPTINFSGTTLNTGNKDIVLSRTAGKAKEGFNLVGNPYPSFLNIDNLQTNSDIQPTVWYRVKNGSYNFDTYNIPSAVSTGNSGLAVTSYIPPMQAFWVRVATGKSSATINLLNANRSHQDNLNNKFRAPATKTSEQKLIRLQVSNGTYSDEAVLYSNPNASNDFDIYDSEKMFNNSTAIAEIYLKVDTNKLVINGMNSIPLDTEIPLGFSTVKKGASNSYSIKASEITNMDSGTQIILKDNLNPINPENDITDGSAYVFTSDSINTVNRFSIIFKSGSISTGLSEAAINSNVYIYKTENNQLAIHCPLTTNSINTATIYNETGQILATKQLISTLTVLHQAFNQGVYIVKIVSNGKYLTKRVIVN